MFLFGKRVFELFATSLQTTENPPTRTFYTCRENNSEGHPTKKSNKDHALPIIQPCRDNRVSLANEVLGKIRTAAYTMYYQRRYDEVLMVCDHNTATHLI